MSIRGLGDMTVKISEEKKYGTTRRKVPKHVSIISFIVLLNHISLTQKTLKNMYCGFFFCKGRNYFEKIISFCLYFLDSPRSIISWHKSHTSNIHIYIYIYIYIYSILNQGQEIYSLRKKMRDRHR